MARLLPTQQALAKIIWGVHMVETLSAPSPIPSPPTISARAIATLAAVVFFRLPRQPQRMQKGIGPRLSSVLVEQMRIARQSPSRVIVHGTAEQVEALAARHGVRPAFDGQRRGSRAAGEGSTA